MNDKYDNTFVLIFKRKVLVTRILSGYFFNILHDRVSRHEKLYFPAILQR